MALVFVCLLNITYIVRDAVVGPLFVAAMYAIYLSPAAFVAVITLVMTSIDEVRRFRLSLGFAIITGIVIELVLAEARFEWFGKRFLDSDIPFVAGINAALIVVFVTSAIVATRRTRRAASGTGA